MDTAKFDSQEASDLDHSWPGTHTAWDSGAWDKWIAAKGEETMGYFTRADIPWQYALADAFTICDAYFCSLSRVRPPRTGCSTGPAPSTRPAPPAARRSAIRPTTTRSTSWTTYPERLQAAGITWQVFANDEVGDGADG